MRNVRQISFYIQIFIFSNQEDYRSSLHSGERHNTFEHGFFFFILAIALLGITCHVLLNQAVMQKVVYNMYVIFSVWWKLALYL